MPLLAPVISTMVGAIVCWNSKEGECRRRYVFVDSETQWLRLYLLDNQEL